MSTSGGSGGGGATPFPTYAGAGTPEGVKTGAVGTSYVNTTNGGLYFKATGAGNTGWVIVGGVRGGADNIRGVMLLSDTGELLVYGSGDTGGVFISDALGAAGTGNGIGWQTNGTDGQQRVEIDLGTTGQFATRFEANGLTMLPGAVTVAGDETFDANTHGPVLVDTTDGHTYRIKTTAGVLGTTQVT